MAGITTRTLRYYDQIGLLHPLRLSDSGYRLYGVAEVDRLQQILFYRELGLELSDIKKILDSPDYNSVDALEQHLKELEEKKQRLEALIQTVTKTTQ